MPAIPGDLTAYLSAGLFIIGAYAMAIYLGLIVWAYRDIRSRSRDLLAYILTVLLIAVFNLPGLVVYLLVRPKEKLSEAYERALAEEAVLQDLEERRTCPGCQRRAEADFIICPYCHHQLRLRCVRCGRLVDPEWDVCPYCGHIHPEQGGEEADLIGEARQIAPTLKDDDQRDAQALAESEAELEAVAASAPDEDPEQAADAS